VVVQRQLEHPDFWFLTSSGRQVFPLDLRAEDVEPDEIAHALGNLCRFGGHCREFYSVAQHSLHVAIQLPERLKLQGLLHDATEAYVGDVIRPLKRRLPEFAGIEARVWRAVAERFSLPEELDPLVKEADNRMLLTEKRDLVPPHSWKWTEEQVADASALPYEFQVVPWAPLTSRENFLEYYRQVIRATS
jgi:hypothetical protein